MRRRSVIILWGALALGALPAFAGAGDFIPTPWENGAYVDLYGSYERDDISRIAQPYSWNDTFFREKVTLYSDGYVYHPRFMQYHGSIAGALKQERYSASYFDSAGWEHSTGFEYEARLFFLPEHPYNLEVFALRYEPLFKQQAAIQHDSVETSRGIFFQYRKKPWLFHTRYSVDGIDAGYYSTDITRLGIDGEYFQRYRNGNQLSFNAAFNPSESSTSQGIDGRTRQYLFGNLVDLRKVRLNSSVTRNDYDQHSDQSGDFTNNQFAWWELLSVYFPWNLRSDLSYRQLENESTIPDPITGVERDLTDDTDEVQLELVHRLYDSLDTSYIYLDRSRASSAGDTDARLHALNLNYTKVIPDGRVNLGMSLGRANSENQGQVDVVNESHMGTIAGATQRFTLSQPYVDEGSVVILLRRPAQAGEPSITIPLFDPANYTLNRVGYTYEVIVTYLPPPDDLAIVQEFLATYSASGDYELGSDTRAYSASVDLLNTTLTPYYSYVAVRSELLSGVFPGTPLDSTTNTAGVRYQRGPWRARAEYQDLAWDVSPYTSWRGEMQYVGALNPTMNFYGTAAYVNKHYSQGTSDGLDDPYTDQMTSASGSVRKDVPDYGLSFSVGGTVSYTRGLVDTDAYSLNSSLSWKIGKMTLSAGANVYGSDTRGGASVASDRTHQYYYVSLRRILF